ncbi:MAG: bile acid:sodium symporter family protein [Immundisolibacter sp.]|uniref:bile acid:sodium symporter family protein n=1 Tax=Immundisolibacter sp. TaxID=1934948 RepID=UPI003EDF152A
MNGLIEQLIPGALIFIMFGMGMELTAADFTRLARIPRPVLVGLFGHTLILPAVALGMIMLFPMPAAFALGLMVVAACPGGAVSNLWTHLARGDVALAVTLTALSAAVAVVWVPILLNLSVTYLVGDSINIRLPLLPTMKHIAMLTVVPVSLGMVINRLRPTFARRMDRPVRILSLLFLALAVVGILVRARGQLGNMMATAFVPVLGYNFLVMALGLLLARLASLPRRQVITLPMEIGVQNVIMAATLATAPQFLGRPEVGLVPSVYGFTMTLMAAGFIGLIRFAPGILGREPADEVAAQSQPGRA